VYWARAFTPLIPRLHRLTKHGGQASALRPKQKKKFENFLKQVPILIGTKEKEYIS